MYESDSGLKISGLIFGVIASIIFVLLSKIGVFNDAYPHFKSIFGDYQAGNLEWFQKISSDLQFFSDITKVREENLLLKQQNESLFAEKSKLELALADASKISGQLSFNTGFQQLPVRIIKFEANKTEAFINKGADAQIKQGDIVVNNSNLLGQVIEVANNYSLIRFITNSNMKIPAIIGASGVKGFVYGAGTNQFYAREIPNGQPLKVGDIFVTAGTDGVYPYGLILGKVEKIQTNETDILQEATLSANTNFSELRDLFVILK